MIQKSIVSLTFFILAVTSCMLAYPTYQQSKTSFETKEYVSREVDCLAKNIYFESEGESFEGKLAVATVTLNRTKSVHFPENICDVIDQKTQGVCQYSWKCQPVRKINNYIAWQESMIVAKQTLTNELYHDKMTNALFYHATSVEPGWGKKYRKIGKIGNHIFYGLANE